MTEIDGVNYLRIELKDYSDVTTDGYVRVEVRLQPKQLHRFLGLMRLLNRPKKVRP